MITKAQFREEVIPNIQGLLPKEYATRQVVTNEVVKSNGNYLGLILKDTEQSRSILPTVNMEMVYEHIKDYDDVMDAAKQAVSDIVRIYEEHPGLDLDEDVMLDRISSFDNAREHIMLAPVAMGIEMSNVPIVEKEGLRFTTKVDMGFYDEMRTRATVQISTEILNRWGVAEDVVISTAIENLGKVEPVVFSPLSEVIGRMAMKSGFEGIDDFDPSSMEMEPMFMLSTRSGIDGAALIMSDSILEDVANKLDNNNFYIIPSSIHECLIVPVGVSMSEDLGTVAMLSSMISEVNEEAVSVDERLSDKLFHYDATNKTFSKAMDYLNNKAMAIEAQRTESIEKNEPDIQEEVKGPKM